MANTYGYARVSTIDQDLTIQEAALRAAGCGTVLAEKVTGTTMEGRAQLELLLKLVTAGDTIVVTRIDRLARSLGDLCAIVRDLEQRKVCLRATEQPIDTCSPAGRAFLQMLGVFAEFETNLRRERQLEGIAKAKAEGKYKGRPVSVDAARIRELHAQGVGPSDIAEQLGVHRSSVYRALNI